MNLKNYIQNNKDLFKIIITGLLIFLLILPLSLKINFMQNDDFVHYKIMEFLVKGDLYLVTELGATFISQGIISLPFALIFGISKLPIFTLIISILNFIIFSTILLKFYYKNFRDSLIVGLLFFVNPIHIYSIFGFMMENYFLFFMLLSIYFYKKFEASEKIKDLVIFNFFVFLSFMVRQFGFLISLSLSLYFLINKKYKLFLIEFIYSGLLYFFYLYIFPRTAEMLREGRVNPEVFLDLNRVMYTTIAYFLYFSAFCFPLIIPLIKFKTLFKSYLFWIILVLASSFIFIIYNGGERVSKNLFYLKNTVSQTGFIFTSRLGEIPQIKFSEIFFGTWDLISKISLILFFSFLFIYYKNIKSFFSILFIVYLGSQIPLADIYDRYTLFLIPLGILILIEMSKNSLNKVGRYLVLFFIFFVSIFNYQASMRFVFANTNMWGRAIQISQTENISKGKILQGYPWFKINTVKGGYEYIFSFSKNNPEISKNFILYEEVNIDFPLNLYKDSNYYIYKRVK